MLLYQIVLGVIIGAVVGIAARKLLKFSKRRRLIDRESMVAMYVALSLFVTGGTALAGSDGMSCNSTAGADRTDLLAAFACGTAFAWDDFYTESIEDSNFSNVRRAPLELADGKIIDLLVNSVVFFVIVATMPFSAWVDSNLTLSLWRLVVLAIGILILRRLPIILALYRWFPDCHTSREAVFIGCAASLWGLC